MTDINDAVKQALESAIPGATVTPDKQPPAPIEVPAHVAANICKFLERVNSAGLEAVAWVEAYQYMQRIGAPVLMQQAASAGVPFPGLGK